MAGAVPGEFSHSESAITRSSGDQEEVIRWYFSRKEIEESSPSRQDGIDLKKETYYRKSYCTFLQDLGMRLKVPQITIATAIIFCHRFFIRQSHAKNDRRAIATVCMFLAGKVEETPRPLKDVIVVSYEIIHKKDPSAAQRIKQKEVYEQMKERILDAEKIVLSTLGFDLNVNHAYKPLVEAIKKFKVAQNALAQVAWNFVNDGLRTSLCLQFKPHHIAAGAIFLAAKFLKVKLPSDGEKVWWQEFDVTPRQLEEVSNQMLELYEQNRVPPSQGSEVESSAAGGASHRSTSRSLAPTDDHAASRQTSSRPPPEHSDVPPEHSKAPPEHSNADNHGASSKANQNQNTDHGSGEIGRAVTDHKSNRERETKDSEHPPEDGPTHKENMREVSEKSKPGVEQAGEHRDDVASHKSRNADITDVPVGQSPKVKLLRDKVRAKLEKAKKLQGERTIKKDLMDEDELIERELEDAVELAVEDEKTKQKKWQSPSKTAIADHHGTEHGEILEGNRLGVKGETENAEEGEMVDDEVSPMMNSRKRKLENSPLNGHPEGKKRQEHGSSKFQP